MVLAAPCETDHQRRLVVVPAQESTHAHAKRAFSTRALVSDLPRNLLAEVPDALAFAERCVVVLVRDDVVHWALRRRAAPLRARHFQAEWQHFVLSLRDFLVQVVESERRVRALEFARRVLQARLLHGALARDGDAAAVALRLLGDVAHGGSNLGFDQVKPLKRARARRKVSQAKCGFVVWLSSGFFFSVLVLCVFV